MHDPGGPAGPDAFLGGFSPSAAMLWEVSFGLPYASESEWNCGPILPGIFDACHGPVDSKLTDQ